MLHRRGLYQIILHNSIFKLCLLRKLKILVYHELTPKEFELLELLMRNKNITLFREKIYEEIWGTIFQISLKIMEAEERCKPFLRQIPFRSGESQLSAKAR